MQSIAVTTSACIISKEIRVYNWCMCIIFSKYDIFGKNWFCNDLTEIWFRYVNMEFSDQYNWSSDQYNWSTKHNLCLPAKTIIDLITEVNRIHSQMLHFTLTVYIIKSKNQWKVWIWGTYYRIFHNMYIIWKQLCHWVYYTLRAWRCLFSMDASIVVFVLFLQYCNKGYLLNWEDTAELKGLCISINTCAACAFGILAST